MKSYLATFYSHYGALTFFNILKEKNINPKLMPVPRKISSSCGTCVSFDYDGEINFSSVELEGIFAVTNNKIQLVYKP